MKTINLFWFWNKWDIYYFNVILLFFSFMKAVAVMFRLTPLIKIFDLLIQLVLRVYFIRYDWNQKYIYIDSHSFKNIFRSNIDRIKVKLNRLKYSFKLYLKWYLTKKNIFYLK